ncbi:response regulator receiver domain-containing protein [Marinimicrobium koreense]|uniref:Response regulator receiver domain-containing protein n=1 Tax=Marinimicrobium koreense TaxID=306545 RepID=A0A3N1NWW2_9GAMM|nr:response regulator [Marinimicrobium koreense]ROQ20695.1 response regulator receiver domain-containing protein [Marinimicrobium koreense]
MPPLEKVMYVEDDPDIREIATLALRDVGGLDVLVCESGQAALASVDAFEPQLLLLDVMMPEMDGPETLEALRRQGSISSETAVAFMTAKVHPEELDRYRRLGVTDVVRKPFDPMILADDVRAIWDRING